MSNKPKRIQRKLAKDWRMPENAVYVGRPTKWGNPYKVEGSSVIETFSTFEVRTLCQSKEEAFQTSVEAFRQIELSNEMLAELKAELEGKDLACWCPLDQPCHADVLLELANGSES